MSYLTLRNQLLEGKTTCSEVVELCLVNIEKNKETNAFIEVFTDEARKRAKLIDEKFKHGTAGRLAGLIVSVKDLIAIENKSVTAASAILHSYTSPFSATVVQHLLDQDAILIGRVNCDEFGMGSSNENSAYGPVRNHKDLSRVPGGSSGGSAVSVQQGACHVSLGTDTGGSVRQPASFCGIYGLKPTYSSLSRYGLLAYASSFDTIGILSNTLEDCELTYQELNSHDEKDSTSYVHGSNSTKIGTGKRNETERKYKIAYYKPALDSPALDTDIKADFMALKKRLMADGHTVDEIPFELQEYLLPTYYILTTAEASSNLSRYDGMRYGHRPKDTFEDLNEAYKIIRSKGFGEEVKRRIFLGTFVLSASYYDAYYTKAQKARNLIRKETLKTLEEYDYILGPVTPTSAFKLGEKLDDPISMYLADLYTVHASVCGLPALSIPLGTDSKSHMPFGLQVMGNDFCEEKLFEFGYFLQNLNT